MSDFGTIRTMFSRSTWMFSKTTDGVPPEKWLEQPGNDSNHLLWIAGHVVVHRAVVPKIFGVEWSAPWEKLFARGAKRVDRDNYPAVSEIVDAWKEVSEKLNVGLASATADMLSKPTQQGMPSLDGTLGGTISFFCLHEIYHVGQMGYLRKWLGYGQVLG